MNSEGSSDSSPELTKRQVVKSGSLSDLGYEDESKPTPNRRRRFLLFGILAFALILVAGGASGYYAGRADQEEEQQGVVKQVTEEQFALGLEDLEVGRYEIAKQRFEYVIRLDPSYPQAADHLAQALLGMNAPIATNTPAASPTPNLAPVEDLFDQAQAAFNNEDWTLVVDTLLALRAKDPSYRAVEADGLMFLALRNRGINRIANEGLLEEGMYDLSRAERFGPLDGDAENWRSWAQLYLTANSFMGLNWAQASFYFGQVYLVAPYMKNDAYIKFAIAAQNYGDQLVDANDPCAALEPYEQSLLAWENATLIPTATRAAEKCETAEAPPPPPPEPEDTPTPGPTDTPDGGGGG